MKIMRLLCCSLLVTASVGARADEPAVRWLVAGQSSALAIEGLAWFSANGKFRRLPSDTGKKELRAEVNSIADQSAGAQIRFRTTSRFVRVRVQLIKPSSMYHMPATGQSGVDLYDKATGELRFCGVSRVEPADTEYDVELCAWNPGQTGKLESAEVWQDVTLDLPLYNGVESFEVGVSMGSKVEKPRPHENSGRIVIYGTSITQGGVASRPGLGWTNQLGRQVDQEVINLGFSGNGMGEPALARRISEIDDMKLVLLDYEANAQEGVRTTLNPFIALIRARHPKLPIVVVSQIPWTNERRSSAAASAKKSLREFQQQTVAQLRAGGDENIYFIDGHGLLPWDHFEDGLVDGVHPNDLGMSWIAQGLVEKLGGLGLVKR